MLFLFPLKTLFVVKINKFFIQKMNSIISCNKMIFPVDIAGTRYRYMGRQWGLLPLSEKS